MKKNYISNPVISRIPRYYRYIHSLNEKGVTRISSKKIADHLGLTASQVRQDFGCFGDFGLKGYGYSVPQLQNELMDILGLNKGLTAILLGCGNMGRALINNFPFDYCGVTLTAAFDRNPELIGQTINGITIQSQDKLHSLMENDPPDIAVLTIPNDQAQEAAERLAQEGIHAIWNFATQEVHVSIRDVYIENVIMGDGLMTLCYKLSQCPTTKVAGL